jgi:N-acetyl-anhydromuramyl-L-alanine amidase AmpD
MMRIQRQPFSVRRGLRMLMLLALLLLLGAGILTIGFQHTHQSSPAGHVQPQTISQAFEQAAREFHVPAPILKAICYMEGRLSNNGGSPSMDNGFGCMHLVQNKQSDTLDRAAKELKVSVSQLKTDLPTNIRGGAVLLRDYARQLSSTRSLPANLGDWYGAVAAYSNSTTRSTALLYADGVYQLLRQGFRAQADDGETITLFPQAVRANAATAAAVTGSRALPTGCKLDHRVDYPGAVDCILPSHTFDCNITPTTNCNFTGSDRPAVCTIDYSATHSVTTRPCAIDQIVIHDIEGAAHSALNIFQNPQTAASAQYVVDSDGTIYQIVREKDIAYHDGNFWSNEHSIGIEHAGFDGTGYRWYNAAEYLASAKLVAYLLKKYHLPLDRAHIVAHGTVPAPSATSRPNHVDPGPYWLWDYYFTLIHQQGVPYPEAATDSHIFLLHPTSDRRPYGRRGAETGANFSFFYLYNGPSTASGRIPRQNSGSDITDVTDNVEPGMSYYYLARVTDPAGNGDMMYKIWYGVEDQAHAAKPGLYAHARTVWLAVPRGAATPGQGIPVTLRASSGQKPLVYSQPITGGQYVIGDAPNGAIFVSGYTVTEDNTSNLWYEIDYNHRQGWVPASEVISPEQPPAPIPSPTPVPSPNPLPTATPVPEPAPTPPFSPPSAVPRHKKVQKAPYRA